MLGNNKQQQHQHQQTKKKNYQKKKKLRPLDKKKDRQKEVLIIEKLINETLKPFDSSPLKLFAELPISDKTRLGLSNANYVEMTDIQRISFGFSLCGRDVLGAAKTGSGKTLAFLIPVIEKLYRERWSIADGLGALIISPTRELALQIFGVLRKIGKEHSLSAGLIIGGKDYEFEKERINRMNILVCTPGRLLQHMDTTPQFDCSQLQMLVLDEADRILDMGFSECVNAIVENLPTSRQTLLFSATQTKSVKDLARLSLRDAEYVAVHEKADKATPDTLTQNYLVCNLPEKLDILYSFLKTHLKSKILIFLTSCKQVRFVYETFCKMQPGTVVMCLHGRQRQEKRSVMFEKFCRVQHAAMLCTDIAARGLDFPAVDWVIQVDCPEDGDTYIHRVGRTARYNSNGRALSFLLPSEEEGMLKVFEKKKIPVTKIAVNPSKSMTVTRELQAICAQNPEIKYLGEKSLICYLRSMWLNKNKDVFDVTEIPVEEYASSLGLPGSPKIKFLRRLKNQKNRQKSIESKDDEEIENVENHENEEVDDELGTENEAQDSSSDDSEIESTLDESDEGEEKKAIKPMTRADKMFAKKNQSILWSHYDKIKEKEADEEEDDLLTLARKDHGLENIPTMAPTFLENPLSVRDKRNMKAKNRVKKIGNVSATQIHFDDDGEAHLKWKLETEGEFLNDGDNVFSKHQKYIFAMKDVMKEADVEDKALHKEKLKEKRRIKKMKEKERAGIVTEPVATLGGNFDEQEEERDEEDIEIYSSNEESKPISKRQKMTLEEEEELALRLLER